MSQALREHFGSHGSHHPRSAGGAGPGRGGFVWRGGIIASSGQAHTPAQAIAVQKQVLRTMFSPRQ